MKVSVIVSIHNGGDILPVTIPPLLAQDYPRELTEIILVDDASTDETPVLLDRTEWRERCKIIRHDRNRGRCATRNTGIKVATGDLMIFLDCDIEVKPTFISQHVRRHENDQIVGVLSNIRPNRDHLKDKYHRYLFYGRRGARLANENEPLPFRYFIMGCSSVKSSAVKTTGIFNENLPGYGIDLEYAYRLWKNFPKGLFYAPEIVVNMHKLKPLERTLDDFRDYGLRNVPLIVDEFPELAPYVGGDFVKCSHGSISLKSLLGSLLINAPSIAMAKVLYHILPYPLSNGFVRYLVMSSIATGYRKSLKSRE